MFKINNNLIYKYGFYTHRCREHLEVNKKTYYKRQALRALPSYGGAVGNIIFDFYVNCWLAFNDEYASIINYCPFCGKELEEV